MHIQYSFGFELAHQQLLTILIRFDNEKKGTVDLVLPAWRPGRYELANYAANIKAFSAKDSNGKGLSWVKYEKNKWRIEGCPVGEVRISYQYFADTINAGSTYIDEDQMYVNPVNCCMHVQGEMAAKVSAELIVPKGFKTSGMLPVRKQSMKAQDLDEWYDSPFQSSAAQIQHRFKRHGINFEIATIGDVDYDRQRIETDFCKFIDVQLKAFKQFPVKRYTFLIQATPHRYYHGVEHEHGTTITLGPSRSLFTGSIYEDLLAVSSHELYHTWNVKYMRPEAMWPYDFTKENYHRIGYIIEGVTTYQGDLKLWQGGAMSDDLFLTEIKTHLDRHVGNMGRFNLSVRESSFDTWVDGYGASIPDRKVSIYTEGALVTMLFDIAIMQETKGKKSIDHVMRALYKQCREKGRSYAESDYLEIIRSLIGKKADRIYNKFIDRPIGYEEELYKSLASMGIKVHEESMGVLSSNYGIRTDNSEQPKVTGVDPVSDAYAKGVRVGMQIIGIDGYMVESDVENLIRKEGADLMLKDGKRLKEVHLDYSSGLLYRQHNLSFSTNAKNPLWKKWKRGIF
ncbi:MAG: M61 family metallopeptidase [Flavobacteriales bacterium]|nr:M61 family metallopeptidase [Flavobacteriales bacterium]